MEAKSAVTYFRAWRCDIAAMAGIRTPSHSRRMANRRSRALSRVQSQPASRNASHPVNAILNYAYAVLQSQVQIKAVADGYDPMLGIMHYDRDGSPAFVFDMMEPERPKVDGRCSTFLKSEALHPADFTIREDGVVRLNPELAQHVARITGARTQENVASIAM